MQFERKRDGWGLLNKKAIHWVLICLLVAWSGMARAQSDAGYPTAEPVETSARPGAPPAFLRRSREADRNVQEAAATVADSDSIATPASLEDAEGLRTLPRLTRSQGKRSTNLTSHLEGLPSLMTVGSSLAIVVGLFCVTAWFMKRGQPGGAKLLPGEAVSVLGRQPLPGRQQMILVRCGSKLLLVAVSMHGAETLTEITDPLEVDRLAGLCGQGDAHSVSTSFNELMSQWGTDEPAPTRSSLFSRRRAPEAVVDATYG
jgi:flagellar biogenesis protein FliO